MPDVRIKLVSKRKRPVDDKPEAAEFKGSHYVHPLDIKLDRGFVLADLVPGRYKGTIELNGFRRASGSFTVKKTTKNITWVMEHRCTLLPGWGDLDAEQKRLFRSFAGSQSASALWGRFPENQSCSFFQVSYALARTPVGGTVLSDYIQMVRVIGGAKTIAKALDGRMRKAAGWRMHVVIKPGFRATIAQDLKKAGFKKDSYGPVPTHARFGFVTSYRQKGKNPLLQVVLNKDASGADVDLDKNEWVHRSAAHDIYPEIKRRFPEVKKIYKVK